ncbi:hypothetical protein J6590_007069 [Homalodisca vitripennis]|nr:hypothetical protein J6590_007069 [Homalodisca vitripennis]
MLVGTGQCSAIIKGGDMYARQIPISAINLRNQELQMGSCFPQSVSHNYPGRGVPAEANARDSRELTARGGAKAEK